MNRGGEQMVQANTDKSRSRSKSKGFFKLDLGSGDRPRDGFHGVDRFAKNVAWRVDLLKFPWPWADGSVHELHSSHYLEHIPMEYGKGGRDMLVLFMDEAWRVLRDRGQFTVIVPNARSNRAFQDPTHRRFFVAESFLYFNKGWRDANGLAHYLGECDFDADVRVTSTQEFLKLPEKEREKKFNENWNTILDWYVILTKRPASKTKKPR